MNDFETLEEYMESELTPLEIAIQKGEARRQTAETVARLEAEIRDLKAVTTAQAVKLTSIEKTVVPVKEVVDDVKKIEN